jgi:hypothetical protein
MFYKKITQLELDLMKRDDGSPPNYTYEDYVINRNEETGEIIEEYYINLTIHMTADEAYEKWLADKDKPPVPDEMEALTARVDGLENINAGLLLENAEHQINIQEQEKMNKEQEVTNANLLLEIAMLKGAML